MSQRHKEEWQNANVKILESSFDDIIEQVYEKLFIDRIWGSNNLSQVKREEFIECLGGATMTDILGNMLKKNKNTGNVYEEEKSPLDIIKEKEIADKKKAEEEKKEALPKEKRILEEIEAKPNSAIWLFSPEKVRVVF